MHESTEPYRAGTALVRAIGESTWNDSGLGLDSAVFGAVDRNASAASLLCSLGPHELDFGPLLGRTITVYTPSWYNPKDLMQIPIVARSNCALSLDLPCCSLATCITVRDKYSGNERLLSYPATCDMKNYSSMIDAH